VRQDPNEEKAMAGYHYAVTVTLKKGDDLDPAFLSRLKYLTPAERAGAR